MKYKKLGNSDLSISEIGFGCMSLKSDINTDIKLLQQAFDRGINYFDTADIYDNGQNEIKVGRAFKNNRDKVIIATKAGNEPKSNGEPGWNWNPSKKYILQAIEKSLQRLQTDYIDLYQLHGGTINDPVDETIEAFELLQQQGKIRHYGISSIRPNVIKQYVQKSNIASVMMQYSLLDRRPEELCLALLKQNNIGVLARGSLASGLLINKPTKAYLGYSESDVSNMAAKVNVLANNNLSRTAVALQFVLMEPAITAAVVGIRTTEQLQEAINAVTNTPSITQQQLQELKNTLKPNLYDQHR